ncbi:MAG: hypothetical protein LBE83_01300 [Propionibacteriaceae bacterium]|jgi:hypothetical protein|nr:hypothetical protein [Propionibacteriaceae bacterium]
MATDAATGTPRELLLTFAELEALVGEEERWPTVRAAMNTRAPADEQVAISGLASLLVRDLARMSEAGEPVVHGQVGQLARRLGRATQVVGLSHVEPDGAIAVFLICAAGGADDRVMVRVVGPGVVALSPLVDDGTIADQAALLGGSLLDGRQGAVHIQPLNRPAVTVRRSSEVWEAAFSVKEGTAKFTEMSRAEAMDMMRASAASVFSKSAR